MTIHQIEQFYIHMQVCGVNKVDKENIEVYLADNGLSDFEWQDDFLVVDGFESEDDAQVHEELLHDIILNVK